MKAQRNEDNMGGKEGGDGKRGGFFSWLVTPPDPAWHKAVQVAALEAGCSLEWPKLAGEPRQA
jgi:hypothetical protein